MCDNFAKPLFFSRIFLEKKTAVLLYPEFATCGCKMEPFAAPFFQHLCDLFSVYAVFRVLRKYTYIYDLHENFDLSFDVF